MTSLSEISGVLSQHPGVEHVGTTIVHRDGQELAVAVVEFRRGAEGAAGLNLACVPSFQKWIGRPLMAQSGHLGRVTSRS